jgi:ferritin
MLSDRMQETLNRQINREFFSAYSYLALTAYFEDINLKGCAHWMRTQYEEELVHANKAFDFVHDRDGRVTLTTLEAPIASWSSPVEAFAFALETEKANSKQIYEVVETAMDERDHATHTFMQWFVNEQIEEEALVNDMLQRLRLVGDNNTGLFLIDHELGLRKPQVAGADGGA